MLSFPIKIGDIYLSNKSKIVYDSINHEWSGYTNGVMIYYHPEIREYRKKVFKMLIINSSHTQAVISTFHMRKYKFIINGEKQLCHVEFVLVE